MNKEKIYQLITESKDGCPSFNDVPEAGVDRIMCFYFQTAIIHINLEIKSEEEGTMSCRGCRVVPGFEISLDKMQMSELQIK